MGRLIERKIPTLYGGVSRQPDPVRVPNQVATGDNALFSVVTGGFEKRPGTQFIAALDLDSNLEYSIHAVDRDATEQLFITIAPGVLKVWDALDGSERTVTVADTERYFLIDQGGIDSTGVVEIGGVDYEQELSIDSTETAFAWSWSTTDAATLRFKVEGSADGSVWNDLQTNIGGAASGTFNTTIGAVATNDHKYIRINVTTGAANASDTLTISATFKDMTYVFEGLTGPEDLTFASIADLTLICNRNIVTRLAEANGGTIDGTVQDFDDLANPTGSGDIYQVVGTDVDGFQTYYVVDDATDSVWLETVDPTARNKLDASSMPHQLVRNEDGTFTYSAATWNDRAAGDEILNAVAPVIGQPLGDVAFFRNRLTLLGGENTFLGQSGDFFNLWAAKATDTLDTDPVDQAATTTDVNVLRFAAVFRKLLFVTSNRAQFELSSSSGGLTPTSASLDLATRYQSSPVARPVVMGDVLYFASPQTDFSVLYEYYFDEASLSNTASDITKHVIDYIPSDVTQIAADTTSGTVFCRTSGEPNAIYVYRTFFDGTTKIQSSWGRYLFGSSSAAAYIHGMAVFSGFLVAVIERADGNLYMEQMPIEREAPDASLGFMPMIDQREIVTGTYDSANDVTTWDPSWQHTDDAELILGPVFSAPGRRLNLLFPDQFTLTFATVTAGQTIIVSDGTTSQTYTAHASTTNVSNRQFSISGTDAQDAAEFVTCITDATYGHPTITASAASNVVTLNAVNAAANTDISTPTGSAVGATVTVAEFNQRVAAIGDFSAGSSYAGRPYTKTVELSKLYMRETADSAAILNGRLQVKDIRFHFVSSGYFSVDVTPQNRDTDKYEFTGSEVGNSETTVDGAPIISEGTFRARVMSNGATCKIEVVNNTPFPSVITAAAWRGFFNEVSRQG